MKDLLNVMQKSRLIWAVVLVSLVILNACKSDPKVEGLPTTSESFLTLDFTSAFGNESIDFNQNEFVTSSKDTIKPQLFKFIFSNIRLVKLDDTEITFENRYGYVSFDEGITQVVLPEVPEGAYKGIKFYLGLDSATNLGDPSQWPSNHPLNPLYTGLHWGWSSGYIFIAHEGQFRNNGATDNYTFHIATLEFAIEIEVPLTYTHNKGSNDVIHIKTDLAKYFDGVYAYSLKNEISASHSGSAHAPYINNLRANIRNMFSAKVN